MKSILIVASVASMIEQFLMPYIEEYSRKNIRVVVATNFENPGTISVERSKEVVQQLRGLSVEVEQVDFARSPLSTANFKAYKQLIDIMSKEKFDIIHSHSPIGGLLTRLAAKNQKNAKVVYTAHGFHFFKGAPIQNWLIYYPIEKYMSLYTDALITMNEEDYNIARAKFKTRRVERVYKVNGVGIDIDKYSVSSEKNLNFKRNLGLQDSDFVITVIAELSKRKNHKQLIEAMKVIKETHKDIKVLFVGQGILEDSIKKIIKEYKLEDSIFLLGYRTDIKNILNITDCCGLFALQEGLPRNIMEAMAASKPVIATNIRGNQDLVVDGETGYLVEVGDIQATAIAIEKMKNETNHFGENGRKQIERYRIEEVLKQVKDIYQNM